MAVFQFFEMAAVRHLGFLKVENFNCPYPSEGQSALQCQILCRSVEALQRYGRFDFSRWRPSAILDLSKMADTEVAQLGSLEKLIADCHI